ncbi:SoxR reducing system RseC family protein [Reinekea sp.]|jgi:sigma-E factor negative regulatory protein RseC|uniref:SoxR reducing system RseC family protein n=1 Tax=Reinekea sp. TaxID=1970455 RepID=UPI002A810C00|nr:SoxR reducing system RseC family protein [Reinekea sp.]
MIIEQGTVVAVNGNWLVVEVLRTSACGACSARQGCGQAIMSEWGDAQTQQQKNHFSVPAARGAEVGARVDLGMTPDTLSLVAILVYLVPLLNAFLGLTLAVWLGFSEPIQLFFLAASLGLSYLVLGRVQFDQYTRLVPQIIGVSALRKSPDIIVSSPVDTV